MSLHRMAFFVYLSKRYSISFVKGSSKRDVCTFLPVCNSPSPCPGLSAFAYQSPVRADTELEDR